LVRVWFELEAAAGEPPVSVGASLLPGGEPINALQRDV